MFGNPWPTLDRDTLEDLVQNAGEPSPNWFYLRPSVKLQMPRDLFMGMGSAGLYLSGLVLGLSLSIRPSLKDGGGEKSGETRGRDWGQGRDRKTKRPAS